MNNKMPRVAAIGLDAGEWPLIESMLADGQLPNLARIRRGPFPFRRTGGHTDGGFAFFSGAGIAPGDLGEWRAIDLPATLVALLGREPTTDLDGRPIPGLCAAVR